MPPTPADSRIFGFFDFSKNVDFRDFPVGFGVWEGLQWIGNGCGLQIDGFSAHFERYESILHDFDDFVDFGDFPVGFGVWEGLQSIGNGCGLQMDGFSAHFEPSESISVDFHDFGHFGVVCDGLMLFPEGPRTLRECPEGPGTL